MMRKKFITLSLISALAISCLGACGQNPDETIHGGSNTLTVLNYGKYLDESVIKEFEKKTGIDIKYEEYTSPEEMYTKYKSGAIKYDVICTSEYIIQKLISEGEVLEQDYSSMSNYGNLDPAILELAQTYDPKNTYTVPYFYGTLGICYDTTKVDREEVASWNILWDERYKNEIIMMNSVRDSFTPAMKLLGYSLNDTNDAHLREALDDLIRQGPLVYAYFVDQIADEMISGNAQLALVYSGEAAFAMDYNEDLAYVVPQEGSNLWIDSWFIPKTCQNEEGARAFLDFLCDAEVGMKNFDYVYYASPLTPVVEALDEDIRANEAIIPSPESLKKCEVYTAISDEDAANLNHLWQALKSAL